MQDCQQRVFLMQPHERWQIPTMVCQCFSSLSLPFSFSLLLGVFAKHCFAWQNLFISLSVPWQLKSSYSQDALGGTFCNSPARRETTWNQKKRHVNSSKCSMQHIKSNHWLKQAGFKMGRQSLNHLFLNNKQMSLWKATFCNVPTCM